MSSNDSQLKLIQYCTEYIRVTNYSVLKLRLFLRDSIDSATIKQSIQLRSKLIKGVLGLLQSTITEKVNSERNKEKDASPNVFQLVEGEDIVLRYSFQPCSTKHKCLVVSHPNSSLRHEGYHVLQDGLDVHVLQFNRQSSYFQKSTSQSSTQPSGQSTGTTTEKTALKKILSKSGPPLSKNKNNKGIKVNKKQNEDIDNVKGTAEQIICKNKGYKDTNNIVTEHIDDKNKGFKDTKNIVTEHINDKNEKPKDTNNVETEHIDGKKEGSKDTNNIVTEHIDGKKEGSKDTNNIVTEHIDGEKEGSKDTNNIVTEHIDGEKEGSKDTNNIVTEHIDGEKEGSKDTNNIVTEHIDGEKEGSKDTNNIVTEHIDGEKEGSKDTNNIVTEHINGDKKEESKDTNNVVTEHIDKNDESDNCCDAHNVGHVEHNKVVLSEEISGYQETQQLNEDKITAVEEETTVNGIDIAYAHNQATHILNDKTSEVTEAIMEKRMSKKYNKKSAKQIIDSWEHLPLGNIRDNESKHNMRWKNLENGLSDDDDFNNDCAPFGHVGKASKSKQPSVKHNHEYQTILNDDINDETDNEKNNGRDNDDNKSDFDTKLHVIGSNDRKDRKQSKNAFITESEYFTNNVSKLTKKRSKTETDKQCLTVDSSKIVASSRVTQLKVPKHLESSSGPNDTSNSDSESARFQTLKWKSKTKEKTEENSDDSDVDFIMTSQRRSSRKKSHNSSIEKLNSSQVEDDDVDSDWLAPSSKSSSKKLNQKDVLSKPICKKTKLARKKLEKKETKTNKYRERTKALEGLFDDTLESAACEVINTKETLNDLTSEPQLSKPKMQIQPKIDKRFALFDELKVKLNELEKEELNNDNCHIIEKSIEMDSSVIEPEDLLPQASSSKYESSPPSSKYGSARESQSSKYGSDRDSQSSKYGSTKESKSSEYISVRDSQSPKPINVNHHDSNSPKYCSAKEDQPPNCGSSKEDQPPNCGSAKEDQPPNCRSAKVVKSSKSSRESDFGSFKYTDSNPYSHASDSQFQTAAETFQPVENTEFEHDSSPIEWDSSDEQIGVDEDNEDIRMSPVFDKRKSNSSNTDLEDDVIEDIVKRKVNRKRKMVPSQLDFSENIPKATYSAESRDNVQDDSAIELPDILPTKPKQSTNVSKLKKQTRMSNTILPVETSKKKSSQSYRTKALKQSNVSSDTLPDVPDMTPTSHKVSPNGEWLSKESNMMGIMQSTPKNSAIQKLRDLARHTSSTSIDVFDFDSSSDSFVVPNIPCKKPRDFQRKINPENLPDISFNHKKSHQKRRFSVANLLERSLHCTTSIKIERTETSRDNLAHSDHSPMKVNSEEPGDNGRMMNDNVHEEVEYDNGENDFLDEIDMDYDIGTGDVDDISYMNVDDLLTTTDEADDAIVIDDDDEIGEEGPDALSKVNKVCELTQEQLVHLVKENKKYLRNIYQGKAYNRRHEDYKKGGKARIDLTYQVRLGIFHEEQHDVVMEQLMTMFCKKNFHFLDYILKVLLPETLVKIYMDVKHSTHEEAEQFMEDALENSQDFVLTNTP
ncbi:unnamed protein product [Owenia fusiformis]|uniref:Uncharacterized protein n=1 Tax=Owenia fusiformis TaxID=6347 RepID=A0A8S4PLK3_OWEFU|nr:unnamed protein product [Owenia fusiformis]